MAEGSNKKTLIIVLVIVGVLLLCCCGTVVGLGVLGIIATPDIGIDEISVDVDGGSATEPTAAPDGASVVDAPEFVVEVQAMTEWFYPGFAVESWTLVQGDDAQARFHVVAASPDSAEFKIAFVADRSGDLSDGYSAAEGEFVYAESSALWSHDTGPSGLQYFVGRSPMVPPAQQVGLFVASHAGEDLLVTDWSLISNVDIVLYGIHESELLDWDGASTTWESAWHSDLMNGTWVESSFVE